MKKVLNLIAVLPPPPPRVFRVVMGKIGRILFCFLVLIALAGAAPQITSTTQIFYRNTQDVNSSINSNRTNYTGTVSWTAGDATKCNVYWGTNSSEQIITTTVDGSGSYSYATSGSSTGTWYLRAQPLDGSNTAGAWATVAEFRYDVSGPSITGGGKTVWRNNSTVDATQVVWGSNDGNGIGVKQYQVYWGTDNNDQTTHATIAGTNYSSATANSAETYYLRVRAIDYLNNLGGWTTVATCKYENTPPGNPSNSTSMIGWTNVNNRQVTWNSGSDESGGSGIGGYYVAYNKSVSIDSASTSTKQISAVFIEKSPYTPALTASGEYSFYVRAVDNAGNLANDFSKTAIYRYDKDLPQINSAPLGELWRTSTYVDRHGVTWSATDTGGSALAGCYVYWGTSRTGTSTSQTNFVTSAGSIYSYARATANNQVSVYYLRAQPVDNAGNKGEWITILTDNYTASSGPNMVNPHDPSLTYTKQPNWDRLDWTPVAPGGSPAFKDYRVTWNLTHILDANYYSLQSSAIVTTDTFIDLSTENAQEGSYSLYVASYDEANQTKGFNKILTCIYDKTSPNFNPKTPADDITYISTTNNSYIRATWNAAQDENPDGYYYQLVTAAEEVELTILSETNKSSFYHTYNTAIDIPHPPTNAGDYYLWVAAADLAGNFSAWKKVLRLEWDATPTFNQMSDDDITYISVTNNFYIVATWNAAQDEDLDRYYYQLTTAEERELTPLSETNKNNFNYTYNTSTWIPHPPSNTGNYYLYVAAADLAGNFSVWKKALCLEWDFAPPIIERIGEDIIYSNDPQPPTFSWRLWDEEAGPSKSVVYWSEGEYQPYNVQGIEMPYSGSAEPTFSYQPPRVSGEGVYCLWVRAYDILGNNDYYWQKVYTFVYDNTKPQMSAVTQTVGWINQAELGFSWEAATDAHSGVTTYNYYWSLQSDGEPPQGEILQTNAPAVENLSCIPNTLAIYYLRVQAVNHAGNTSNWTTVLEYLYDQVTPGVSSTDVTIANTTVATRSSFTWEAATDIGSGVSTYNIYWGPDESGESSSSQTGLSTTNLVAAAMETTYNLRVQAVDNAGNTGDWKTVLRYIWAPPPTGSVIISDSPSEKKNTIAIDYVKAHDDSFVTLYLDYKKDSLNSPVSMSFRNESSPNWESWMPVAPAHTWQLSQYEGLKTVYVRFIDARGIISVATISDTIMLGMPYVKIYSERGHENYSGQRAMLKFFCPSGVSLDITGIEDAGEYALPVDKTLYVTLNVLANGTAVVTVNYSNADFPEGITVTASITVDQTSPVFNPAAPVIPNDWSSKNIPTTVNWDSATDINGVFGYRYYFGKGSTTNKTLTYSVTNSLQSEQLQYTEGSGTYNLWVLAEDMAGNQTDLEKVFIYKYDATPPSQTSKTFVSQDWTDMADVLAVTWNAAADDESGSGVAGYNVYWGQSSSDIDEFKLTTNTSSVPLLCTTNGIWYLRVQTVDHAGNVSAWKTLLEYRYTNSFKPTGSILINGGAAYTTSLEVNLTLSWGSIIPVKGMYFDSTGGSGLHFKSWKTVATDYTLNLPFYYPNEEGLKTVTVKYRDERENESEEYSASIFYDKTTPNFINPREIYVESASVTTSFSWPAAEDKDGRGNASSDKASGVAFYNVYWGTYWQGTSISGTTNIPQYTKLPCATTDRYYLRAQPVDAAGNVGNWATLLIFDYTGQGVPPNDPDDPAAPEVPSDYQTGNGGTNETIWSFPNPFSPANGDRARIAYTVEEDGPVKVFIYNLRGVKVWQQENMSYTGRENQIVWDGSDQRGRAAANGSYIMILTAENKKVLAKGRLLLLD
ncbi:MAG: fibronectin type III domain-containing protein [Candidatus Margulisbacteria bacterium]|nr:fibronectin type III domain-containing protein [Candidatus Margulisiibacteriota bacterium]